VVLTKRIIKNCFMWVTCNHPFFCKENPTIVYKITFNSLPLKPTSSSYIWIFPSHSIAIYCVAIPMRKPLVIFLPILFQIFLNPNLFIVFCNILFPSFFTHGIKPILPNITFHTIFKNIIPFSMYVLNYITHIFW